MSISCHPKNIQRIQVAVRIDKIALFRPLVIFEVK